MSRFLPLAVLILPLALSLASCTPEPGEPDPGGSDPASKRELGETKPPVIALVMKDLGNEFFQTMSKGASEHASQNEARYSLLVDGIQNESDLNRQVGIMNELIARGVDAIVLAPADSKGLVQVVGKAQAAGIPVINIDNKLDDAKLESANLSVPFVGPNNRDGARKVGEYLATKLPEDARVAILEGIPSAFNAVQRRAGFEDAMKAAGATVVDVQSAKWDMNTANQIAAGMLAAHPDLDAILASNDSMAIGALAACQTAGRDDVLIVGFDNTAAANKAVQAGELLATADQYGDKLAVFGIEAALAVLDGGEAADRETAVDLVVREGE